MMQKHSAQSYVLYLLAKREYSQAELRQKLRQKAYPEEDIESALARAVENGWQSDERFCAVFIRYRAQQGYGPRRLKQELRQKGIADWLLTQALDNAEIDWFALAEKMFEKKCPAVWDYKAKQKMWRYLVSRGFYQDHFDHLMNGDYAEDHLF